MHLSLECVMQTLIEMERQALTAQELILQIGPIDDTA